MTLQTVVLAGGLGTRMRPATARVPKALLPVAGQPFAFWQMRMLARNGVHDVLYAVGYLGEQVEDYVGDGSKWGLSVRYSYEEGGLLGTGGALRLAFDRGLLDSSFFVIYGDSYLNLEFDRVEKQFKACSEPALMVVLESDGRWGPNNVIFEKDRILRYDKRAAHRSREMQHIDYGLLALERDVIVGNIGPRKVRDLADVLAQLSREGRLAGYEVATRFYEVGSSSGLSDLEAHLAGNDEPGPEPLAPKGTRS